MLPRRGATLAMLGALMGGVAAAGAAPATAAKQVELRPDKPNEIAFAPAEAKFVRLVINVSAGSQPCIDELEVYAAGGKANLALAVGGAKAAASSCLAGYAVHQIAHLNDGLYGNGHSWIAAGAAGEWAQIELPKPAKVARVVFSRDREGHYADRMPLDVEVRVSADGKDWRPVARVRTARAARPAPRPRAGPRPSESLPPTIGELPDMPAGADDPNMLRFAFAHEAQSFWRLDRREPIDRVLGQLEAMIDRFASRGIGAAAERGELAALRQRQAALADKEPPAGARQSLLYDARLAKRRLMLRDPQLEPLTKLIFVKRHPYLPSHNYSDMYDSRFAGGGGVCTLTIPRVGGRLEPLQAQAATLFDANGGIARDVTLDWDARTAYFAWRPPGGRGARAYWHLHRLNIDASTSLRADGGDCREITTGPFHDYYPCVLPDGDLVFVSTRCKGRYLCWVPMAMTLFRCRPDGSDIRALSYANISEWGPSIRRDGRVLWTRSEYQDKGADYGHSLWAARPDGTHPEHIYGNNSGYNVMNGQDVPGTREVCATLISHFGDFNGPIVYIDPAEGRDQARAAHVLTPDNMATSNAGRFRDPVPISRDYVLCSHLPDPRGRWAIYLIDRYGDRELLYADGTYGSMCPQPLRPRPRPPILARGLPDCPPDTPGTLVVTDIYRGLGPNVARGSVKYIRIVQEMPSPLERQTDGTLKETYPPFQDYYASPTHRISGPSGWPTYVAKGVAGTVPVEPDGSAHFSAPSGETIYFQALDANYTEIQRMRSVMQLQPGEQRSCVGCHEDRLTTGVQAPGEVLALRRGPSTPTPPPWGAGAFFYEKVVQPVLNAKCVRCHNANHPKGLDLTGVLDRDKIPASYRTLITRGLVHYFSMNWHLRHTKAEPLTFGTVKSKLFAALAEKQHKDVLLTTDELHAIKCWIDLNVPLWGDYTYRLSRPGTPAAAPAAAAPVRPASPARPSAPACAPPAPARPGIEELLKNAVEG